MSQVTHTDHSSLMREADQSVLDLNYKSAKHDAFRTLENLRSDVLHYQYLNAHLKANI